MDVLLQQVKQDMDQIVSEWFTTDYLKENSVFIIGCSTSEVAGKQIGTAGSEEIAAVIFGALQRLAVERQIHLAFQCCEHLNRAVVLEASVQKQLGIDPVAVIPHPGAGGSMASYAFRRFHQAVVVEEMIADAGMDIGNTLIGMHLKRVAVPLQFNQKKVGHAHLVCARTRPKLIGGERAKYN